jgi:hypothetical protein
LPKAFQLQEDILLDNGKTKERLLTKIEEVDVSDWNWDDTFKEVVLQISRYPLASTKKWIEENKKEVSTWDFTTTRTIRLSKELKVVAI